MYTNQGQYTCLRAIEPARSSSRELRTAGWLLPALFLLLPTSIWAQATGTIGETVTDPTGAVIPGAKITAKRIETGVSQSTVTGGSGTYTIPNLVVGTYDVTAEGGGFKIANATGMVTSAASQATLWTAVPIVSTTLPTTASPR